MSTPTPRMLQGRKKAKQQHVAKAVDQLKRAIMAGDLEGDEHLMRALTSLLSWQKMGGNEFVERDSCGVPIEISVIV